MPGSAAASEGNSLNMGKSQLVSSGQNLGLKRTEKPPKLPPRDSSYAMAVKVSHADSF